MWFVSLSPCFRPSLGCFWFIFFHHSSGPAILLRRNNDGDAGCWSDSELYTSTFRSAEEIDCLMLRSWPVDSYWGCVGRIEIKLWGCGKQLLNMAKSLSITLIEGVCQPVAANIVGFWLHSQMLLEDQITASVQNNLLPPSLEYKILTVCVPGCCGLCFCHLRIELSQIKPRYHLYTFRNRS